MASFFPGCFLFPILLFLHHITRTTQQLCGTKYCGDPSHGPSIQSPFYLKGAQSDECGYPNFEVSCNNLNQTMITLGDAGDFVVTGISLKDHQVWMNDPNSCLPLRFLNGDLALRLKGSPFQWITNYVDFIHVDFLKCRAPLSRNSLRLAHEQIPCLSGIGPDNFTVVAVWLDPSFPTTSTPFPPDQCDHISSTSLPVEGFEPKQLWNHLHADLRLKWNNCMYPDPGVEDGSTACYNHVPDPEPARSKFYKILAVGVAGALLFCVAGLARLLGAKMERPDGGRPRMDGSESDRSTTAESVDLGMGLDESTIEQYPTTQVGQSGRLPNPAGDNVCPICLSEYEPMDTLRTIPHCDHYFHAHCIDSWLKKKGTCPLCRYLPHASTSLSLSSSDSRQLLIPT